MSFVIFFFRIYFLSIIKYIGVLIGLDLIVLVKWIFVNLGDVEIKSFKFFFFFFKVKIILFFLG